MCTCLTEILDAWLCKGGEGQGEVAAVGVEEELHAAGLSPIVEGFHEGCEGNRRGQAADNFTNQPPKSAQRTLQT